MLYIWQVLRFIFDTELSEPEIPDIQLEEETAEGEGTEQAQGEAGATTEDVEPQEQALGVSTPTGDDDSPRKGSYFLYIYIFLL